MAGSCVVAFAAPRIGTDDLIGAVQTASGSNQAIAIRQVQYLSDRMIQLETTWRTMEGETRHANAKFLAELKRMNDLLETMK